MEKGACTVLRADEHEKHRVGEEQSGCFYFSPLGISSLVDSLKKEGKDASVRAARIEVTDTDVELHKHPGAVVAFITAGRGIFKTTEGDLRVQEGDVIYIPENTPHLSIADKGTVMIEHIVYISDPEDMQVSMPA